MTVKINCPNPKHQDDVASCAVYPDHLHCFGCGYTEQGTFDVKPSTSSGVQASKPRRISDADVSLYEEILYGPRRARVEYLERRGLDTYTIRSAHLGHTGDRFTIPVYSAEGEVLNIRSRLDPLYGEEYATGKYLPKYSGVKGHNQLMLYPLPWFVQRVEVGQSSVYVVEGELDCLVMKQHGYCAVTVTNGAGQLMKILDLLAEYPQITKLKILGDQDAIGRQASSRLAYRAAEKGYHVETYQWNACSGKDASEYLTRGYRLEDATKKQISRRADSLPA